jgi:CheY-like chemotaxis protein
MRLLWVEDHATFVRVAGRQFLAAHAVTVVPSLVEARRALAEQPFDAVLLDHDLPDGAGPTLIDFIRQLPRRPAVVAVSSHDAGNRALLEAGADCCCPKTRFAEVETVLTRAVAALPGHAPTGPAPPG